MAKKSFLEGPFFGNESCLFGNRIGNIIKGILSIGEPVPLIILPQEFLVKKGEVFSNDYITLFCNANSLMFTVTLLSLPKNHCNEIGTVCRV